MPNYTLVLITDSLLARIDVRVRSKITIDSIETAATPENASIASLVASALAMGPTRTNPVWLFCNRFWTGTISIPSDMHAIANSDELNQAAILEAETQSGIPAFQSKVVLTRIKNDLHGEPQYWVTQALDTELASIEQAFCLAKAKWTGIAHVALDCPTDPSADLNPIGFSLGSDSEVRNWALETIKDLSAKTATRPYFTPPVKVLSPTTQTLLASVLASLTVVVCTSVYIRDKSALQSIELLSVNASKQNESAEALTRQLQKAELSLVESRKKRQDDQIRFDTTKREFELNQFNQSLLSGHCVNLIDAIANSADSDSWLRSIESNAAKTTLKGLCLNEASAHRFASSLEQQPKLVGHTVSPAQITPLENDLIQFLIGIDLITATESTQGSQETVP